MKKIPWTTSKIIFSVFLGVPLLLAFQAPIFLAGASLGAYLVFSRDLPEVPGMLSYQPRTVSTFYADDGTVIGIFYNQKRFVKDLNQIPQHVINAFLAAEDSHFFEHNGVDWPRIVAAMLRNFKAGRITQGGSTITMQVTRNFLLSRERRVSRKIKEMILASRLEKAWGKEKILHVYLNEIYLGEGCYGVEAAARTYFDKPVEHLTIAEGALIAGLVASPARFNPFKSEELARQRQQVVLNRMLRAGFINQADYDKARDYKLSFRKEVVRPFDIVPDFAEAVRRYIVKKYGEEKLYNEGLKVFTTCRIDYQRKALEALEKGLEELKSRQKHLAILNTVPKEEIPEILQKKNTPELQENKFYEGIIVKVTPRKNKEVYLDVALSKNLIGQVRLEQAPPIYKVGQVLALRFEKFVDEIPIFTLDRDPKLQGALVCIENRTGYVRAIVGGTSADHFKFNRAIQAKRQPGSAFKPFIYAAAIEKKSYSPATIIVDEWITVEFDNEDVEWEPRNAGGNFLGPLSLRRALELSRNICTIKILLDIGLDPVIELAHKMGISSELGRNLSLSLGTSELSLLELTSAYSVFPNGGIHIEPVLVKRIEDRFGNVLEDNTEIPILDESEIPKPTPREEFASEFAMETAVREAKKQEKNPSIKDFENPTLQQKTDQLKNSTTTARVRAALSPQTAYVMTSLLQGVVRQGTGARMSQYLKRKDLAGKTGTTNKAADTWFIGFNPDFTTGVWVGFDEKRPLGDREEGAKAALPIWGYFMRDVLDKKPERDFPVPLDITFKDMLTFAGNTTIGFSPKIVREPVYTPFAGKTLVMSPLDPPEVLAQYRGIGSPLGQQEQPAQGMIPLGSVSPPQTTPIYPIQPPGPLPLHPMDGRNLFPEQQKVPPTAVPTPMSAPPPTRSKLTNPPVVQEKTSLPQKETTVRPGPTSPLDPRMPNPGPRQNIGQKPIKNAVPLPKTN